jgi:DNA (cytosine-5)-methyltransferase 1
MTVASFFAGIGGFDVGAERAGFTVTHHSEIDKNCVKLLASRFPDAKQLGSVTDVERVPADIICGGFPCQDLSVAGRRSGLDGERSGLFYEIARVIENSKPRWFVLENVPGLLSSGGGRDMAIVLDTLAKLGYGVAYRILDSQYFGVAQRRRRVFIVGSLGSGRVAQILFEREGLRGNPRKVKSPGQTAPTLFASGAGTSRPASAGSESEFCIVQPVPEVAACLQHRDANASSHDSCPVLKDCTPAMRAGNDSLSVAFHVNASNEVHASEIAYSLSTNGNASGRNAPTINQGYSVRRLLPTECEALQGFERNWTAGFADATRYKMLGNAVTVNVAEWIFKRIAAVERGEL